MKHANPADLGTDDQPAPPIPNLVYLRTFGFLLAMAVLLVALSFVPLTSE